MSRLTFLACIPLFLAACGGQPRDEVMEPSRMDPVVQKIIDMNNIVEYDKRAKQAEYVTSLIEKHFTSIDKERAVAELEKYLSDENDAVVFWTACSLSKFGKDAKPALPKWKEVLKTKEKLIGDLTSESAIRAAISRIED
jgi:HEAT repeat protein